MIVLHHLNDSRSQRVLWLLEELGLDYRIQHYRRDRKTRLAPPDLLAVHPLGKSPILQDGDFTLVESGAILDYLVRHYGAGRMAPPAQTRDFDRYQQWMHYAEGSAMLPLMLNLYVSRLGEAGQPLQPRIDEEIATHLGFIDRSLAAQGPWLLGGLLSAADIQMSFVGEVAGVYGRLAFYPALHAWVLRFQALPAYRRALAKGGDYRFVQTAPDP